MTSSIEIKVAQATQKKDQMTASQKQFHDEYWRLHDEGEKRFGSVCSHSFVAHGTCLNCLRKVVA